MPQVCTALCFFLKIQHVANQMWDHGQENIFLLLNIRAYFVSPKIIRAYHKLQAEWQNTLVIGHTNLSYVASTIYTDRIYQFFCSLLKNFTPTTIKCLWVICSKSARTQQFKKKTEKWYIEKKSVLTCKLEQAHIASYFYRMQCSGDHVEPSRKIDMKPLLLS